MTPEITTVHPVFARQLDAIAACDHEAMLANYAEDAVLLRFDGVTSGRAELHAMCTGYLAQVPKLVELTNYTETADTIFYEAVMTLNGQPKQTIGTMVLRDGQIWRQTAAFL